MTSVPDILSPWGWCAWKRSAPSLLLLEQVLGVVDITWK